LYFLKKYRYYLDEFFETIGYCLMPTHFHFLVRVKDQLNSSDDSKSSDESNPNKFSLAISKQIAILLRSYSRAFNKMWSRHGNLFNQKTNAKPVPSDRYMISLLTYIHQNPVRSGLAEKAEEWKFSSYQDYIDMREGTLPSTDLILGMIKKEELREFTDTLIRESNYDSNRTLPKV
jgi:REP element-mobilizing transposase RayT